MENLENDIVAVAYIYTKLLRNNNIYFFYSLKEVDVVNNMSIYCVYLNHGIPQRMVLNNLGPDPTASRKALDPNNCRQPTL